MIMSDEFYYELALVFVGGVFLLGIARFTVGEFFRFLERKRAGISKGE